MHNENKVPLIRLAKRDMMEPWKVWCIRLASIVLALLLGGLVMMIALPDGATPIDGYATIITGALGKKTAIRQTVKLAVPLLGCALAIAPCFKMRFWNIGAEGQITAGAIAASYFALYWVGPVRCPAPHHGSGGRCRRRHLGADPRLLQGQVEHQRNALHSHDELHHHRRRPLAAGRSVGRPSRLADHPPVR